MDKMFEKWGGGEVLKKAVSGMLPKNRLRDKRLARLKVFEGVEHPYEENVVRIEGVVQRNGIPPPTMEGKVMEAIIADAEIKGQTTTGSATTGTGNSNAR
ncbi:54S ribosomal protein L23, mitochondrial [Cyphellophora attinorum]|uniref:54S ribosomal protein L23, mitochondrial n=1 Tax=Cyphellophora attinorum TaxID=1664694 RepID=A0A0N1P138_9EURO|nr:54S ribosomal protein L23, mitochondrial [Phialophora attinorum]KPI41112.1 54S ribosomal protein L23, mitochondrial [Phialophora attinorum]